MNAFGYDTFGVIGAVIVAIASYVGATREALSEKGLFQAANLKWICLIACSALLLPLLYFLRTTFNISLKEAYFLTVRTHGWIYVLMAYSALAGLTAGALFAQFWKLAFKKNQKLRVQSRSNSP